MIRKTLIVVSILSAIFVMPSWASAADQILAPLNADTVTDDATPYLFQTDDGANQWVLFQPDGTYFCGDSINGYGAGINYSINDWATACGTTLNFDGDFHYLLVDARTGSCTSGGMYADCLASGNYLGQDVMFTVAVAPPPPPPAPIATSTAITTPEAIVWIGSGILATMIAFGIGLLILTV